MTQLHHRVRIDVARSVQEISSRQQCIGLPEDFGYCYADTLQIEAGLLLNQLHYCPQYALEEETQATYPKTVMVLTVGLQGCSKYQSNNTEQLRVTIQSSSVLKLTISVSILFHLLKEYVTIKNSRRFLNFA